MRRSENIMSKQKITFESEGLKVVGNLFRPHDKEETSLPVVLVAGAMTGVKEQVAGNYAERIAQRWLCYFSDRS